MADIKDAYNRLDQLRERHKHEAPGLEPAAKAALENVFEENAFIKGMCKARVVGHHVTAFDAVLRNIDNSPIRITAGTSGATVFADRRVNLVDLQGQVHRVRPHSVAHPSGDTVSSCNRKG